MPELRKHVQLQRQFAMPWNVQVATKVPARSGVCWLPAYTHYTNVAHGQKMNEGVIGNYW